LPPPEWAGRALKNERRVSVPAPPLSRKEGEPAAEGRLRARLEAARANGDLITERDAAHRLARWLASAGRGLDEAVAITRRVLELQDDPEIRLELAGWLESLGDPAAAADALRPVATANDADPTEAARLLVHVGVLAARAGDAKGAERALTKAVNLNPADATAAELRATLAAWAPEIVSPADAAEAYVEAAARWLAVGAMDAQLEDLRRAFDTDSTSSVAAAALAAGLIERGKTAAADEVWRAHATAVGHLDPRRAGTVHARRRLHARAASDTARALAAALDEGLDADFDGDGADVMDDLLLRVGLLELLAARLMVRAECVTGAARARLLEELARLLNGPLARPDRAATARVLALAADPSRDDAMIALRAHASETRDATHLVEALVRAVLGPTADEAARAAQASCARALGILAEEQLRDAALAVWAYQGLLRFEPHDPGPAHAGIARNSVRHGALRDQVALLRRDLELAKGSTRLAPLHALAVLLRSMPDDGELHSSLLAELIAMGPEERRWIPEAHRLAWRRRDYAEVARLSRAQILQPQKPAEVVQARIELAAACRAMEDWPGANQATRDLLLGAPGHRAGAAAAWVSAVKLGDPVTRALAIEELSASCSGPVRANMLAVAAQAYANVGDRGSARRLAELGCQADPASARCTAMLADTVLGARDRTAASALERGITVVGPRSTWCSGLAEALESLGELAYAVGWTQRWVALRPGNREGIDTLLRRIARARDGARLADALSWVMSQPQPAAPLAELVARALRDLVPLDGDRAVVLARRALDAFGPRPALLREALLDVADAVRDDAFAAVVLERALAVDFSADRTDLVLSLVGRRAALKDADGEARGLARAMREGMQSPELDAAVESLEDRRLRGDGEIARLSARAEWLGARPEKLASALAWRELGGALWDLAGDRVGAVRAWLRAAKIAPHRGYVTLGVDLAEFAGSRYALDCLSELIEKEPDRTRSGAIAAEAARAALALDEPARALELAAIALERSPTHAGALELAERGAVATGREKEMSRLYETLGTRALGRYGCRAAHYRGARFFEQRGDSGLALKHAALAFCAVPSEGATFLMLKRSAERADDRPQAVRTVVQVADAAKSPALRAGWLLRAAALASADEEGGRLKVDVLLRAVLLVPDLGTLSLLTDATRELLRIAPEERPALELRLSRASLTATAKVEGPEGARVALAFVEIGLEPFDDAEWAMRALGRALEADADMDEYARLERHAAKLATAESAETLLAQFRAMTLQPYSNVGLAALKLLAAVAAARADRAAQIVFTVLAAERDPDDDVLVRDADVLARADDNPAAERFEKKVPRARRSEAFRALAKERFLEGAHDDAIKALERAAELADGEVRTEIEREIGTAYEAAGRAEEVEGRAMREATSPQLSPAVRASRWNDVARRREARGDYVGTVDALLAAVNLDGTSIERWSAIERVSELARLDDVHVSAIREIAARVAPDAKVAVLRRLARAYEARLDRGAAEATWQEILRVEPEDEEADQAAEALISARGDYSDLANHLGRRAKQLMINSGTRESLRAVRLRRAAILEQRLGRAADACDELLLVLRESPDNVSAMSYLADLYERMEEFGRAAPLWARVAELSRDPGAQNDLTLRAARVSLAAHDHAAALALVKAVLARDGHLRDALDLRVEIARGAHDDRELGDALSDLAARAGEATRAWCDTFVEAARAAERVGDLSGARVRAKRAAELAPDRVDAQLLARTLEYRVRGAGTPDEARRTIEELSRLPDDLAREDSALQAFLLAEALDACRGGGAGMRTLVAREAAIGSHPLLDLGIAERYVGQFNFDAALPHFQTALLGDVSLVRDRGKVALAAAETAVRSDRVDAALRLLDEAAAERSSRAAALMRRAQIFASRGDPARARGFLRELAETSTGDERARALAQLGRMLLASTDPNDRAAAEATFGLAIMSAPRGSVLELQLIAEQATFAPPSARSTEETKAEGEAPDPSPESRRAAPSLAAGALVAAAESPVSAGVAEAPAALVDVTALERAVGEATSASERSRARLVLARAHLDAGAVGAAELCLNEGLAEGGLDEGNMLAQLLEPYPERSEELVKIRRRQVVQAPGDLALLEGLRRAALADHNSAHARAIEHVMRAFDAAAGSLPPPPLASQREQPGILALLTRQAGERMGEALALVWEAAHVSLARDPSAYTIAAAEKIVPGSASPIAPLYEAAIRVLDAPRIPLYVRNVEGPVAPSVALVWPAAAIVSGTAGEETPEVRYVLGQALAAALPQNALLLGLLGPEARAVWSAILGAFGPTELGRGLDATSARLAESFWQTIPTRIQRRLQELLAATTVEDLDAAIERSRQSCRRIGMFLSGDFAVAARALLEEEGRPCVLGPGDIASLAAEVPAFADLLHLALSPEYAEARWTPVPPSSQRGSMSSGRIRLS
jgi:tetratricopeptide (TPR) repeat protein